MGLLAELQQELSDTNKPLQGSLLKAKILAAKLNSNELREWADRELDGYALGDPLPSYRIVTGQLRYTIRNGLGGLEQGSIAFDKAEAEFGDMMRTARVGIGVSQIEGLIADARHGNVRQPWPPEEVARLSQLLQLPMGRRVVDVANIIAASAMTGVLGSVRSKLLGFVLDIEKRFPDFDGASGMKSNDSAPAVHQVFHQNFYGGNNAVASHNFTQISQSDIRQGDFASLSGFLQRSGVPAPDLAELKTAIEGDTADRPAEKIGKRVGAWIGGMTGKAVSGAWNIAVEEGTKLLMAAAYAYYGLPPAK